MPTLRAHQHAIDAAAAGDVVLVAPGTYVETITFRGKAITVESEQGPDLTIIDGGGAGFVATFSAGETRNAVLRGFTLRNGLNSFDGGGVLIRNSSPSIIGHHIVNNGSCSGSAERQGSDPDGDPVTLTWTGPFGTASGASAVVSLPAGTHVITGNLTLQLRAERSSKGTGRVYVITIARMRRATARAAQ